MNINFSDNSKVSIRNIKPGTMGQDLINFFSIHDLSVVYATIKACHRNPLNVSSNVLFETEDDATKACNTLNGADFKGQRIYIQKINCNHVKTVQSDVYVKNLDYSVTQQDLLEKFGKFGEVLSAKLENFPNGTSKCCGYVKFNTSEEADIAIKILNQSPWKQKIITVSSHGRKQKRFEKRNICIKNLPSHFTESHLADIFELHGDIDTITIQLIDDVKQATISFLDEKEAMDAFTSLKGTIPLGFTKPLIMNMTRSKHCSFEKEKTSIIKKAKAILPGIDYPLSMPMMQPIETDASRYHKVEQKSRGKIFLNKYHYRNKSKSKYQFRIPDMESMIIPPMLMTPMSKQNRLISSRNSYSMYPQQMYLPRMYPPPMHSPQMYPPQTRPQPIYPPPMCSLPMCPPPMPPSQMPVPSISSTPSKSPSMNTMAMNMPSALTPNSQTPQQMNTQPSKPSIPPPQVPYLPSESELCGLSVEEKKI
ncbi:unnamed protein product [Moneuplotes crassus]|uniref:RRM domain-containing protein n=1 Tax=Euplotes crassus TaxID=5936 RepID=A0AAD1U9Q2_EUPCR|nr:unnamed protein product [Moneuplotes crassus]